MNPIHIPSITIKEILSNYSVVLLDSYGVLIREFGLVNGSKNLINSIIDAKKSFYVLTNDASVLPKNIASKYHKLGLNINENNIITSGCALKIFFKAQSLENNRCVVLGTNDTIQHVENAGGTPVLPHDDFDSIIIGDQSGFQFTKTINSIINSVFNKIKKNEFINIILLNPDVIFPIKQNIWAYGPASIAVIISEAIKSNFPQSKNYKLSYIGKPHKYLFKMAFDINQTKNMVMLGDQIMTDIKGANNFGIDSVLINNLMSLNKLQELDNELKPKFVMNL
ncbi:MAG: hypothetical protein CL758_01930 [Chloroflexi bacterium]|nr:hypothetical protein [Chloroflexota bacterium]|tara:strand:+ start:367 stop:1209 length:843 start_codon:yes stop_codon:yes gene_type:complete